MIKFKNVLLLIWLVFLLTGCMQKSAEIFDPMAAASETGVDVTLLPDIGLPTTSDDGIISYDYSAAEGDKITERKFSGVAEEVIDGQGAWFSVVPASGGAFTGNIDIGDNTTSTEDRFLQIGNARSGDGISYIDLVADGSIYTNFGARLARQGGVNGGTYLYHHGTGGLSLYTYEVAAINFYTAGVWRGSFPSGGGFRLVNGTSINEFSTDGTLAGDSDDAVPTEKAVLTYIVNHTRETAKLNVTTADKTLSEAEVLANKYITNQGAAVETDIMLDDLEAPIAITFLVEEALNIEVNPPSGESFDLDEHGVLGVDDCVDSDSTVGSKIVATRMQNAAGTWYWSLDSARGTWSDTGASD